MPTGRGELLRGGTAALLLLVTGCSVGSPDDPPTPVPSTADALTGIRETLDARARALLHGNERAFLRGVDRQLRGEQRVYFDNLDQLPIAQLSFRLDPGTVVRDNGGYAAVVKVLLQLDGYDVVPVITPDRYRFMLREGRYLLSSVDDAGWERANDLEAAPWERGPIDVVEGDGVLGIFDEESVDDAPALMASIESSLDYVAATVPVEWSGTVVVYALSDLAVLADLDDLPGGDPDELDGVAFPVQAAPRSKELAATRFILHPRMLDRPSPLRDRLIRHELTHVAIGARDDHVPTWLAEGIAEWVSVQPLPMVERVISREALEVAQAGVTRLPPDDGFNGEHSGANYGLSWWACEAIVVEHGEAALWELFGQMSEGDGTTEAEQDGVLRRVLGIDSKDLARKAASRIVATFG